MVNFGHRCEWLFGREGLLILVNFHFYNKQIYFFPWYVNISNIFLAFNGHTASLSLAWFVILWWKHRKYKNLSCKETQVTCVCFPFSFIILKGYLRYKTITSQNVSSWAQKSYVLLSRYSSFCIFSRPMIYQICDVMMSISTWDGVFWNISFEPQLIKSSNLANW